MEIRERHHETRAPRPFAAGGDTGTNLTVERAEVDRLLAASDQAIERALSADSRAFLQANKQHGGQ